jgi:hypothetical protein
MKRAMEKFLKEEKVKDWSKQVAVPCVFSHDLAEIAKAFGELQDARHLADYDIVDSEGQVGLSWASERVDQAKRIFEAWDRARSTNEAKLFLATLIFDEKLKK